jgi:hypothetical protein
MTKECPNAQMTNVPHRLVIGAWSLFSHSSLGFRHFPWFRHSVAPGKFCNAPTRSGQLLPVTGGVKDFIPAKAALLARGTTVAPQSST